jgi:hypothetical protein
MMDVSRSDAVAILKALGHKQVGKYAISKLQNRFDELVLEEDFDADTLEIDSETEEVLKEILERDQDEAVTIVADTKQIEKEQEPLIEEEDEDDWEDSDEEDEEEREDDNEEEKETAKFVVNSWYEINDPQDKGIWKGQLLEIQNEEWGVFISEKGQEWEVDLQFATLCKAPNVGKQRRLSRDEVVMKIIKGLGDKDGNILEICEKADEYYARQGGKCKSDMKKIENSMNRILEVLKYFHVLEIHGEAIFRPRRD